MVIRLGLLNSEQMISEAKEITLTEKKLFEYISEKYPNLNVEYIVNGNGVKWKQYDQYILDWLEKDIRNFLGDSLSEFYWVSSYQYVYVK